MLRGTHCSRAEEQRRHEEKGEEKERKRECRTRFRLALLHNFIALSPVFATRREGKIKKKEREREREVEKGRRVEMQEHVVYY